MLSNTALSQSGNVEQRRRFTSVYDNVVCTGKIYFVNIYDILPLLTELYFVAEINVCNTEITCFVFSYLKLNHGLNLAITSVSL